MLFECESRSEVRIELLIQSTTTQQTNKTNKGRHNTNEDANYDHVSFIQ